MDVLRRHGIGGQPMSNRNADRKTSVNHVTIGRMTEGYIPEMESVVKFALAFGEDVNAVLEMCGYPSVEERNPERLARSASDLGDPDLGRFAGLLRRGVEDREIGLETLRHAFGDEDADP